MERHSFRIVLVESPETIWKQCLSTKFPQTVMLCYIMLCEIYLPSVVYNFVMIAQ